MAGKVMKSKPVAKTLTELCMSLGATVIHTCTEHLGELNLTAIKFDHKFDPETRVVTCTFEIWPTTLNRS